MVWFGSRHSQLSPELMMPSANSQSTPPIWFEMGAVGIGKWHHNPWIMTPIILRSELSQFPLQTKVQLNSNFCPVNWEPVVETLLYEVLEWGCWWDQEVVYLEKNSLSFPEARLERGESRRQLQLVLSMNGESKKQFGLFIWQRVSRNLGTCCLFVCSFAYPIYQIRYNAILSS